MLIDVRMENMLVPNVVYCAMKSVMDVLVVTNNYVCMYIAVITHRDNDHSLYLHNDYHTQ